LIHLATIDDKVVGEFGKIFSTDPHTALGRDGKRYFIKGCNGSIAFKEVAGCSLAGLCGLKVPPADFCIIGKDIYGGVEEVPGHQRNIRPWLREPTKIVNWTDLYRVIAVDTWLVNHDRNMGKVVGSTRGNGTIDLFMIDFEKSLSLGENPFT
jgi:hypothetical protein